MDFSGFLVLPLSAIIAFATVVGAVMAKRAAPRLIWPWALSILVAALVLLKLTEPSRSGIWLFTLFGIAWSAAIGTVIGGVAARAIGPRKRG